MENIVNLEACTIKINDCIALCHIVDDFEEFLTNLRVFSRGIFGDHKLNTLYKYIKDNVFVTREIRDFYFQNRKVLDAIHEHTYISNFLLIYFNSRYGTFDPNIVKMYNYLLANKEQISKVLAVLRRLEVLNFDSIKFNENMSFEDVYTHQLLNDYIFNYLDGELEIIPSINGIKYKSKNANYLISIDKRSPRLLSKRPQIVLNNLVFDPKNLPKEITVDETLNRILELKKEKKEADKVVCNAIYCDDYLNSLVSSINNIDEIIESIKNSENKTIAKQLIDSTRENILGLKAFFAEYEKDAVESALVSREVIEQEKLIYKKNKEFN